MARCRTEIVSTPIGRVEIARVDAARPAVLFFPGGHCSALTDCGWDLYAGLGYTIVSFSRPGYGRTRVGDLSAVEFMPAVEQMCGALEDFAATIPGARLAELDSPTHLFWIGPQAATARQAVRTFLTDTA